MKDYIPEEAEFDVSMAKNYIESILVMKKELEARWQEVVKMQATYYDKKWTPKNYAIEQQVWLSAQNIQTTRLNKKLDFKRHKLFQILDTIRKQVYRLKLFKSMNIHHIFYVLLLEPYVSNNQIKDASSSILVEDKEEYEVE